MTLNFTIDKASDDDSRCISRLIFKIWQDEYKFKVHPDDFPDLKAVETYYRQHHGGFYSARLDGNVIGTIAYEKLDQNSYVLKRMFVHESYRGKGVAQPLLDKVMHVLPQKSCIYLSTKEDLALAAKQFYLKNNFDIIDSKELPAGFPIFYEDDLFMKKCVD